MRAYVIVTGTVFGLVTVAHIWRASIETQLVRDPWFILLILATVALCVWALRLLRQWPKG